MRYVILSRVLRNLHISPTHIPPLTTCTMYNDFIYHNTDNTSPYTEHITTYVEHITIYQIPHNICKIYHNI